MQVPGTTWTGLGVPAPPGLRRAARTLAALFCLAEATARPPPLVDGRGCVDSVDPACMLNRMVNQLIG